MAVSYNRAQIRAALAQYDPAISEYLDLESGTVIRINEEDNGPATELRRKQLDESPDRYRYIPSGNAAADDAAVEAWLKGEGL